MQTMPCRDAGCREIIKLIVGKSAWQAIHCSMELNQFTDYSLRALIFVALREGEMSSIKQIASAFAISENHLVKVVHKLGKLGYLQTVRGRNGGVKLARQPEDIGVGEVVRAVESFGVAECMPPRDGVCCLAGVCALQRGLQKATQAFMAELDKLTVADLIVNRDQLTGRLEP